jgi:hypothetical protein
MAGKPTAEKTPRKDLAWSVPVMIAQIPEGGSHVVLEADAKQRAALAALAGLRDVSEASASFDLAHTGNGTVHAVGRVRARIGQTCVVTLDPIENDIDEAVDVTFAPPSDEPVSHARPPASGEEGDLDEIPDPPEPIVGGAIDLGRLAADFLFLGIDPYPRKPDAVFDLPPIADDPEDHPFAALKALKDAPLQESGRKPKKK